MQVVQSKAKLPVDKQGRCCEDYTPDLEYIQSTSGLYGVVGRDVWSFATTQGEILPEQGNPRAYLCKEDGTAISLDIPKVNGTNKRVQDLWEPKFSKDGQWLYATMTTDKSQYIVGWKIKQGRRGFILHSYDKAALPSKDSRADEYAQLCHAEEVEDHTTPFVRGDPHTIWIGNKRWERTE